jgi:lipoprotein-anchoring transpeptidase ErfK/SrfK
MRRFFVVLAVLAVWLSTAAPVSAYHRPPVTVRILSADGAELSSFAVASANQAGGMSLEVADLGDDGVPEIILGNGLGNEPRVRVMRADGSEVGSFLAYDQSMGVGVNVAACDLDADGVKEVITVPQRGGAPHVRLFNNFGSLIDPGFFAYDESLRVGINLACGNLDADDADELVTLPAAGGAPHVKIWERTNGQMRMQTEWYASEAEDRRGLVGAVQGGELILVTQHASKTNIKRYVIHSPSTIVEEREKNFSARGITSVFLKNDSLTFTTEQPATVVEHENNTTAIESTFGSVVARAADIDGDGSEEIITAEARPQFGDDRGAKSIVIDLSEQRLYAYENGLLSNTFLVSTARPPWTTPLGRHTVTAKVPLVHYAWYYGSSSSENYDLGWVPYNLKFFPHIYIHYAPWHNNFGHVMSHGCVNVALDNILWLYEWAEEKISVEVRA